MAQWTDNAKIILASRYLIRDKKGEVIEAPDDMLVRVATFISKAEKPRQQGLWQDKFFTIMDDLEFLPNSPTLMNSGRELGNLSACLAGDTIIHTIAGDFTIKELADKYKDKQNERFDVYSTTSFSTLGVDKAFAPRITREKAPVYKIAFDDGSFIKATEDHLIMCRNGKYCRVDELKRGQSIMPFNYDYNHGYKVTSIEFCGFEDVYDLSTEKYHNFAANNVFVHNCYLIEVEDDLAAILEAVKRAALIHKTGGGTGIVFSKIRPANFMVGTTSGVASGPVSFMKIFDTATEVIKQGGVRRGANLGTLIITHPDILDFITCKDTIGEFENFNISVAITDSFIKSLKNGRQFTLKFRGEPYAQIDSKTIFKKLCHSAHKTGDPGILFIDTANKFNPLPKYGPYMGTNPCGEQWLQAWSSCNLGSIDVSKFVNGGDFDWERLSNVISTSIRFLDDVISVNKFPNVKIKHKTLLLRPVGLGIMGWADSLLRLNVKYDSAEALNLADKLMTFINIKAHEESNALGQEKGYCDFRLKRRNSSCTCIAPTGTLSMLADCSSSIEPIFDKKMSKAVLNGKKLDISSKYADSKAFITAHEVAPEMHIKMQAAFQAHVDNAVSKTVNLPEETPVSKIEEVFLSAWELGCKGVTIFREGCRAGVIESTLDDIIITPDCKNGKCNI